MTTHPQTNLSTAFQPLIGLCAWNVANGWGTMITMEFGEPYLAIREPIIPSAPVSDKVRRNLSRRRVSVLGQWHFWIEHAHWTLRTNDKTAGSQISMQSEIKDILSDLDGQKLLIAEPISVTGQLRLVFDLGAILEIWPATDVDADQWSLREKGGPFLIAATDGGLSYAESPLNAEFSAPKIENP